MDAAERAREKRYQEVYGITIEEFDKIDAYQNGVCAICHRPPKNRRLNVDHSHLSGLTRGLLCFTCNSIILSRGITIEKLRAAADYLENPPATKALGSPRYGRKGPVIRKRRKKKDADSH